jgi:hypothetical protein
VINDEFTLKGIFPKLEGVEVVAQADIVYYGTGGHPVVINELTRNTINSPLFMPWRNYYEKYDTKHNPDGHPFNPNDKMDMKAWTNFLKANERLQARYKEELRKHQLNNEN